jgi:hypothetical protein
MKMKTMETGSNHIAALLLAILFNVVVLSDYCLSQSDHSSFFGSHVVGFKPCLLDLQLFMMFWRSIGFLLLVCYVGCLILKLYGLQLCSSCISLAVPTMYMYIEVDGL